MNLDNYVYQDDLYGFPIPRVIDIARRMKYHKIKLYKKCSSCENQTLNKPTHHFCLECLIRHYDQNTTLDEFIIKAKPLRSTTIS